MCMKLSLGDLNSSPYLTSTSIYTYEVTIIPMVCDDGIWVFSWVCF